MASGLTEKDLENFYTNLKNNQAKPSDEHLVLAAKIAGACNTPQEFINWYNKNEAPAIKLTPQEPL